MDTPKITVYIPSHNYGKFLREAIESVLRQTVDHWELLVIDDASTDSTPDVMTRYKGDERIHLYTAEGIGLPAVCNLALGEARGEYVIRLDADDIFDENILLVLGNYLDRNTDCAMVFPDYFLIDEYNEIFAHERTLKVFDSNHVFDSAPNGACCLIRKQALLEVGGYREDLGAQDGFDLWRKLLKNHTPGNINVPLFYYRRHSDNLTNSSNRIILARQQLTLENVVDKLDQYRPLTAIIPCRMNYDFVPNLWRTEMGGKSLLQRAIGKCTKSSIIDNIVVTSDTEEVCELFDDFRDSRISFFKRKPENTLHSLTLARTLSRVVKEIDSEGSGTSVVVYAQAPFVTTKTMEEAIYTLILNEADTSLGVEEVKHPMYQRTAYGLKAINPPKGISTDFDIIYRDAGISVAITNKNLRAGSLLGPVTVKFIVAHDENFVINSERSLRIAEILDEDQ